MVCVFAALDAGLFCLELFAQHLTRPDGRAEMSPDVQAQQMAMEETLCCICWVWRAWLLSILFIFSCPNAHETNSVEKTEKKGISKVGRFLWAF